MVNLDELFLYRITHIDNVKHIISKGITHSSSLNYNSEFKSIGYTDLINKRKNYKLENNKYLGDYIPFYFCPKMPMLYVIQKGNSNEAKTLTEEIAYCVTTIQEIINQKLDYIFTDGHAIDNQTKYFYPKDINNIDKIIDWESIKEKYWINENNLDLKRKKQAEFLVYGDISSTNITYIVYNSNAVNKLTIFGAVKNKILLIPECYF